MAYGFNSDKSKYSIGKKYFFDGHGSNKTYREVFTEILNSVEFRPYGHYFLTIDTKYFMGVNDGYDKEYPALFFEQIPTVSLSPSTGTTNLYGGTTTSSVIQMDKDDIEGIYVRYEESSSNVYYVNDTLRATFSRINRIDERLSVTNPYITLTEL